MNAIARLYNCKDEELPVTDQLVVSSVEADKSASTAYSSGVDGNYVATMK